MGRFLPSVAPPSGHLLSRITTPQESATPRAFFFLRRSIRRRLGPSRPCCRRQASGSGAVRTQLHPEMLDEISAGLVFLARPLAEACSLAAVSCTCNGPGDKTLNRSCQQFICHPDAQLAGYINTVVGGLGDTRRGRLHRATWIKPVLFPPLQILKTILGRSV